MHSAICSSPKVGGLLAAYRAPGPKGELGPDDCKLLVDLLVEQDEVEFLDLDST